ncbi:MAG: hypothetical protein HC880_02660 [Bacteroidia bacterium]|nr:hypothetical protein [Bacteroidia bacterium]
MERINYFWVLAVLFGAGMVFCPNIYAQNDKKDDRNYGKHGFTIGIGGGASYFYGADNEANQDFDEDFLSWQGNARLGYTINEDRRGLGTFIGVFGTIGNTTEAGMDKLFDEGQVDGILLDEEDQNLYYSLEGGAVFLDIIRLSAGVGFQDFTDDLDDDQQINYYSATLGLQIPLGVLQIQADVNRMFGMDLGKAVYRPSVGIMFRL